MGDSLWGYSLPDDAEALSESISCEQPRKQRIRGERFQWSPLLTDVLRSLLPTYPSVSAFKGLDRLEIFRTAVQRHNEQQVSLLFSHTRQASNLQRGRSHAPPAFA